MLGRQRDSASQGMKMPPHESLQAQTTPSQQQTHSACNTPRGAAGADPQSEALDRQLAPAPAHSRQPTCSASRHACTCPCSVFHSPDPKVRCVHRDTTTTLRTCGAGSQWSKHVARLAEGGGGRGGVLGWGVLAQVHPSEPLSTQTASPSLHFPIRTMQPPLPSTCLISPPDPPGQSWPQ